jgi:hypothetical protein
VIGAIALPERELVGYTFLPYSDVLYGMVSAQVHTSLAYLTDHFPHPLTSDLITKKRLSGDG